MLLTVPSLGDSLGVVNGKVEAKITTVPSIEGLRKYAGSSRYVNVGGYYEGSLVGGGLFVAASSSDSRTDNGGTVIVSENGTRWIRVHASSVTLYDFGFDAAKDNAAAVVTLLEKAALGVTVDCLNLEINVGSTYPSKNKYTNGKFIINGNSVDVHYQQIRSGIGRFISGTGAASKLKSKEWTGAGLVVIGEGAMASMEKCVSGIAIGDRSQGFSRISRDNISIGADSLINVQAETEWYDQSKMAGTRNVAIGGNAGRGITSGYSNVAIGRNCGQGLDKSVGAVTIGVETLRDGNNPGQTVAIGDAACQERTHFATVAIGYYAAPKVQTDSCVFIGDSAGYRLTDGSVSTGVIRNSVAIGRGSRVGGDNEVQIGNQNQTVYLASQANVRSDLRDKADIQPLNLGLSFVNKLSPISGVYDKRDAYVDELFTDLSEDERAEKLKEWWANPVKDGSKKEDKRHFWFGAQDVDKLQSEFGELPMVQHQVANGTDTYSLAYAEFIPVLVKAVQELSAEVQELKALLNDKKPE